MTLPASGQSLPATWVDLGDDFALTPDGRVVFVPPVGSVWETSDGPSMVYRADAERVWVVNFFYDRTEKEPFRYFIDGTYSRIK